MLPMKNFLQPTLTLESFMRLPVTWRCSGGGLGMVEVTPWLYSSVWQLCAEAALWYCDTISPASGLLSLP